jgi:hypothetical protein
MIARRAVYWGEEKLLRPMPERLEVGPTFAAKATMEGRCDAISEETARTGYPILRLPKHRTSSVLYVRDC